MITTSPSRCPPLLLPSQLTSDHLGGLDEFPSGSDPRWGGERVIVPRGNSSHKFGGLRLPGGCLTSTSRGPRCPGAAGDPHQDLSSLHGKKLGAAIPRAGPCIPHPRLCILRLQIAHRGPHSSVSRISILSSHSLHPTPCSLDPCSPGPCSPPPPRSALWTRRSRCPGGCGLCSRKKFRAANRQEVS